MASNSADMTDELLSMWRTRVRSTLAGNDEYREEYDGGPHVKQPWEISYDDYLKYGASLRDNIAVAEVFLLPPRTALVIFEFPVDRYQAYGLITSDPDDLSKSRYLEGRENKRFATQRENENSKNQQGA